MKKRIVALILTVVMSLLALTGCSSYDIAKEDFSAYATFDKEAFIKGINNIVIEDGKYTTDDDTRALVLAAQIYNTIADKVIAETKEESWKKTGELSAGDVLYFVYYATDADGNVFFSSNMNKSTITDSTAKYDHVVKLGDYFGYNDKTNKVNEEFLKLIVENLKEGKLEDYAYSMLTKADLENKAVEALKETKPEATEAEISEAKKAAIKVKDGDTIYISYTVEYPEIIDGKEGTMTKKAAYEMITLDPNNAFHAYFLSGSTTANVGGTLIAAGDIKVDKSTYKDVKILWKVENAGNPISEFTYTPYTEKKEVTPDNLYYTTNSTTDKVDLNGKALTYHVYPVYAIDAPSAEEITAADILYYVNGKNLKATSYEAFETEGYKNGSETLESLLKDIVSIVTPTEKDNKFYKEGDLKKAYDSYSELVKAGGDNPTTEQKTAITAAQTVLTEAQNVELRKVMAKIADATSGDKKLGDEILEEYEHNTKHSLKEAYDADIVDKVQKAVLELVKECVTTKGNPPAALLDQFVEHLYESYEYEYYTGSFDKDTSNVEEYKTFEKFLEKKFEVTGEDKVREKIEKEAKGELELIIKIFVVSNAIANDSSIVGNVTENMRKYVEADKLGGGYDIDEEAYKDYYGDKADKQIKKAEKNAEKSYKSALKEADMFIVDNAYMRYYKSNVGSAFYRNQIKTYGEINLRTAIQFNKLFYYLTCTDIEINEEEGHAEIQYTEDGTKISFRTVSYSIGDPNAEADAE